MSQPESERVPPPTDAGWTPWPVGARQLEPATASDGSEPRNVGVHVAGGDVEIVLYRRTDSGKLEHREAPPPSNGLFHHHDGRLAAVVDVPWQSLPVRVFVSASEGSPWSNPIAGGHAGRAAGDSRSGPQAGDDSGGGDDAEIVGGIGSNESLTVATADEFWAALHRDHGVAPDPSGPTTSGLDWVATSASPAGRHRPTGGFDRAEPGAIAVPEGSRAPGEQDAAEHARRPSPGVHRPAEGRTRRSPRVGLAMSILLVIVVVVVLVVVLPA